MVIRGVPIYVNWSLPFLGAAIAYLPAKHAGGSGVANYLAVLLCLVTLLVLHEVGHAVVARICSLKVHAIVLSGYGGCCISDVPRRLSHAAFLAAGGLLAQLLVLVITIGFLLVDGSSQSIVVNSAVFALIGVNIVYMLVNLAPFQGSDGARLLVIAKQALSELRKRRS
ncbi:hypothetical protein RD110_02575 [Rhodoferax koreense]|uniref:Peptidase M50 domain-containing protein n=2 Tax=Rhodoferax koreensis TaxID=1842727 RepID=A0A1P8JR51_9BURK|nr:hypothetical protein RD110_02575 [Rhodoferax koreense]